MYHQNKEVSNPDLSNNTENNVALIGKADLDLSMIFTNGKDSSLSNEIKCNVPVPIFPHLMKSSSPSATIGKIFCNIALRDLGKISVTKEDQSSNAKTHFRMIQKENHSNSTVQGKEMEELAALDIEKWKYKQKERFQQQLENLEQHHMNTLSEEWNKRYSKITFLFYLLFSNFFTKIL